MGSACGDFPLNLLWLLTPSTNVQDGLILHSWLIIYSDTVSLPGTHHAYIYLLKPTLKKKQLTTADLLLLFKSKTHYRNSSGWWFFAVYDYLLPHTDVLASAQRKCNKTGQCLKNRKYIKCLGFQTFGLHFLAITQPSEVFYFLWIWQTDLEMLQFNSSFQVLSLLDYDQSPVSWLSNSK